MIEIAVFAVPGLSPAGAVALIFLQGVGLGAVIGSFLALRRDRPLRRGYISINAARAAHGLPPLEGPGPIPDDCLAPDRDPERLP